MTPEQLGQLKAQLQEFKLKLCDSHGLYATASDYDELHARASDLIAEVERLAIQLSVVDGNACIDEQMMGNGPCGICRHCLRADADSLRTEVQELRQHIADLKHDMDATVKFCDEHHRGG